MLEAPMWTVKKTEVINDIDKEMYRRGTCQGSKYVLE
jgi:radical SAM superfamily enzyme